MFSREYTLRDIATVLVASGRDVVVVEGVCGKEPRAGVEGDVGPDTGLQPISGGSGFCRFVVRLLTRDPSAIKTAGIVGIFERVYVLPTPAIVQGVPSQ